MSIVLSRISGRLLSSWLTLVRVNLIYFLSVSSSVHDFPHVYDMSVTIGIAEWLVEVCRSKFSIPIFFNLHFVIVYILRVPNVNGVVFLPVVR